MDRQSAHENAPESTKDRSQKLRGVVIWYNVEEGSIWNMDENASTPGTASHAITIARTGRRSPRATHDGTWNPLP